MSAYVVWMEMDVARVFKVAVGGPELKVLNRHEMKHHTSRDPENHKDCEKFYHDVSSAIADAEEVFLIGPGLAKTHFKAHLDRHHHGDLARKVVGMETAHHMSDAAILAASRTFFRKQDRALSSPQDRR